MVVRVKPLQAHPPFGKQPPNAAPTPPAADAYPVSDPPRVRAPPPPPPPPPPRPAPAPMAPVKRGGYVLSAVSEDPSRSGITTHGEAAHGSWHRYSRVLTDGGSE
jgi:hypothetical protein